MRFLIFLVSSVGILSCSGGGSAIHKQLTGADSMVIQFNTPQTSQVEKTVSATDKAAIKKLIQFVDGKPAEAYKCGYSGNLQFFANGKLAGDFSFNYEEGCRHFIQLNGDQLEPTVMSNEAADFLKSLAAGKSWY